MEIICDDRETKICALAENKYDNVYVEHLNVGDFIIGFRGVAGQFVPMVVVERKTWADLAASIKDGRINNVEKLRAYRDETGARIAYLLEGSTPKNPEGSEFGGIPYRNLRAHLDHLLYRDGIIELHTTGPADSLRRLLEFARNSEKFCMEQNNADGLVAAKVKVPLTDDQISDKIWSSFKGVSATTARAFRHLRVAQLYTDEITEKILADTVINGRKFGAARAAAIFEAIRVRSTMESLLCALPNISTKRARMIMECVEGAELFTAWNECRPRVVEKVGKTCTAIIDKYFFSHSPTHKNMTPSNIANTTIPIMIDRISTQSDTDDATGCTGAEGSC